MALYGATHPSEPPELSWRIARAAHAYATSGEVRDAREEKRILEGALTRLRAVQARGSSSSSALWRWSGILSSTLSELQDAKTSISSAFAIKADFERALAIDPADSSAHHLLGRWSASVAALPRWKRLIASTLFAEPPTSSMEEARDHFARAEALSPGFWVANRTWLAKAERALGHEGEARAWAIRALELPVLTEEDAAAHAEAQQLLAASGA